MVWWISTAAFLWGLACLLSMLQTTGGHLSMPLDDSYIFFQYARRTAEAGWFTYQEGGPPSTGATSLLTVCVDAIGYLAGFRGPLMSVFALILGSATLAWAGVSAWRLGQRLCPSVAWLPPGLILLSGPLGWGFMSGMDIPVFVSLALAFAARWPRATEAPTRGFFILGGLLGLARPDAMFLVLPAFVMGLRFPSRRWWWSLPLTGVAVPFLIQIILTGSPQSASMDVKSVLSRPDFAVGEWLTVGLSYVEFVIKGVFGGGTVNNARTLAANNGSAVGFYLVPFALLLFVLGLCPGAWQEGRQRRPGLHLLLLAWAATLTLAVAFTVPRSWHWHRYLIPIYAVALPGIAVGADRAGHWLESAWRELKSGDGARVLGVLLLVLSLPSAVFFAVAYGRNCSDIYYQHIQLAHRLNDGNPVRPRILGTHDAGALAYFADYRLLDMEGLVSEEFRKAGRLGAAGVWETLESLPPERRPDVLAVYPTWFQGALLEPHRLVHSQRLFRSSITGGNPINVYLANWRLAGRGDAPRSPELRTLLEGRVLMTEVDVADLGSEKKAEYRYHVLDGAYDTLLRTARTDDDDTVIDGGRVISGWEEFTVTGTRPGDELVLVMRSNGPFRIRVETNGAFVGIWSQEGARNDRWEESAFAVPPGAITEGPIRIRLGSDDPHHSAYGSFHYWVYRS